MKYKDKKVCTLEKFDFSNVQVGDYVEQDVVDYFLNNLTPISISSSCTQPGGAVSERIDTDTGKIKTTFSTFKKVADNVWEYCGDCFRGENVQRGEEPYYLK